MGTGVVIIGAIILILGAGLWVTYKVTTFITKVIMWGISFLILAGVVAFLLFKYGVLKF